MKAVIIAVGSELLSPGRRDSNSDWLIARLADCGVETVGRIAVDDDAARIASAVLSAFRSADIIVTTGGLGPTDDDRTREGLSLALGLPLTRDPEMVRHVESLFLSRGRKPSDRQALQADRLAGANWIPNALGSAPGMSLEREGRLLAVLPGVPAEMMAMFDGAVAPKLHARARSAIARITLRIAGRPESYVDDLVRDLYGTPLTTTTILASAGTVELLVTARGGDPADAAAHASQVADAMKERLGIDVYGTDDDTLAFVTGGLLGERGANVAVAESCTGGLLGAAFTDVPGASSWFVGGVVAYSDDLKIKLCGVPEDVLRRHGAVSAAVAMAMAAGIRAACSAEFGLGITGIAGPSGATPGKPVGTVHIALADAGEGRAAALDWPGDRALIRRRAVNVALDLLRRRLLAR